MSLIHADPKSFVSLRLRKDLLRSIQKGHPWIYANALAELPVAPSGSWAVLKNGKGRFLAFGIYDPAHPIALRICSVGAHIPVVHWVETRLAKAYHMRKKLFGPDTTGFRLIHGEGDGLPGLVCDIYNKTAVIQLDGEGMLGFWNTSEVAQWLQQNLNIELVYQRVRSKKRPPATVLLGQPNGSILFQENGIQFTSDAAYGQKTGFFLDQRDNRQRIEKLSAGKRVLNTFGYTGGFSVYAGRGGANHVTTLDLSEPALELARHHWDLNQLPAHRHRTVKEDAFIYLEEMAKQKKAWDIVILDPPSFATSQAAVPTALAGYKRLISAGARVTASGGILAAASCSSHITMKMFRKACLTALMKSGRSGGIDKVYGQPPDHPWLPAFPEGHYLKFILLNID